MYTPPALRFCRVVLEMNRNQHLVEMEGAGNIALYHLNAANPVGLPL
jgi:hypothetical protein